MNENQAGIKKPDKLRRRRRHKSGEKAIKEIKYYQSITRLFIPVAAIRRVIREALRKAKPSGVYLQQKALEALHVVAEDHLVRLFERANLFTLHAKRKTLMLDDLLSLEKLCNAMKGIKDSGDTCIEEIPVKKSKRKKHKPKPQLEVMIEEESAREKEEEEELSIIEETKGEEDWCLEEC